MLDVHSPPGGALGKSPAADTRIAPLSEAGTAVAQTEGGPEGRADAVGHVVSEPIPMPRLLLAFLKLGSISIGGRSASYLQDELVDRLHWLRREDWLEGHLLGRILPGPSGVANAMFMAHRLRGSNGAAWGSAVYVLPGVACAILLSTLIFGVERPIWANGIIHGLSAGAIGLFLQTCLRNVPTTRKTRLGPLVALAAFLAYALLHIDLVVILVVIGSLSLLLNLPRGPRKEHSR